MQLIWAFFTGALFCNATPHLVAGLQGRAFPTPFSRPRGVGPSTPLVNVFWGLTNFACGLGLAMHEALRSVVDVAAALAGALAIGVYLALHFGKIQPEK